MNRLILGFTIALFTLMLGCASSPKPVSQEKDISIKPTAPAGLVTPNQKPRSNAPAKPTMAKAWRLRLEGKKQDAARMYQELAQAGNEQAMIKLGEMYVLGEGVKTDDTKAAKLLGRAAENGNRAAQFELAKVYSLRDSSIKDYKRATHWFIKAAEQGHVDAQFNVGVAHQKGYGVPKDIGKAITWFRKAAEKNHDSAQFKLGVFNLDGVGLPKDKTKAFYWMHRSAKNGNEVGQLNTGLFYILGVGVAPNQQQAKHWLEKAVAQGNKPAVKHLAKLKRQQAAKKKRAAQAQAKSNRTARANAVPSKRPSTRRPVTNRKKPKQRAKIPKGHYDWRAANKKFVIKDPEIKCLVAAHKKLNKYWTRKKYNGQLTYSYPDDREKFEFYWIVNRMAYSMAGSRPQQKYDGLLDVLFNDKDKLKARFQKKCVKS